MFFQIPMAIGICKPWPKRFGPDRRSGANARMSAVSKRPSARGGDDADGTPSGRKRRPSAAAAGASGSAPLSVDSNGPRRSARNPPGGSSLVGEIAPAPLALGAIAERGGARRGARGAGGGRMKKKKKTTTATATAAMMRRVKRVTVGRWLFKPPSWRVRRGRRAGRARRLAAVAEGNVHEIGDWN